MQYTKCYNKLHPLGWKIVCLCEFVRLWTLHVYSQFPYVKKEAEIWRSSFTLEHLVLSWQVNFFYENWQFKTKRHIWSLCAVFLIDRNACDSIHLSGYLSSIFHLLSSTHLLPSDSSGFVDVSYVMLQRPWIACLSSHNRMAWML